MNLLQQTERFDHPVWQTVGGTVTRDTLAPPAFAGPIAKRGDTINTTSGSGQVRVQFVTVPDDTSPWTGSLYVAKDADVSRFPVFLLNFAGGSSFLTGVEVNTQTGDVTFWEAPPDAYGVVDVDPLWWRVWWMHANTAGGNVNAAFYIEPAASLVFGAPRTYDIGIVGSLGAWGANLTNTDTLQPYEPDPFYPVAPVKPIRTHLR